METKTKRTHVARLSLILAAVMLLSSLSCFASCATTEENGTGTTPASEQQSEESTEFYPDVAEKEYNETFLMLGFDNKTGEWYYAEELTNGLLNDAIYEMNKAVENRLGVTIRSECIQTITSGGEVWTTASPTIMTGDDVYQMCILHPYYSYVSFIDNRAAYDLYKLDSIDFDQKYWNREVVDSLAVGGHAFIGTGSLCKYVLYTLFCNKKLMKDAGRTVPYDDVRNGKWTMDKFYTLTSDFYADDGDGKRNNADVYGFAGLWDANGSAMLQAADIQVAQRNEDDEFVLAMDSERLVEFYQGLYQWSRDESTYLWSFGQRNDDGIRVDFETGRGMFTLHALDTVYLGVDFDVGILPLPKYDEMQDNYRHVNWGNNIVVPSTIKNPEMVGDVLELMAYYSSTIVHSAFYDTILQYRMSHSPDDREMVELIYSTVVYDPAIAFCDGNAELWNLVYTACFGITGNKPEIGSFLKSNKRGAERWLSRLFQNIK